MVVFGSWVEAMINVRERVVELHGEALLRKSAMNIRGGAGVFERVLAGKGYRTVLEIGTYRGISAAEIAQYCERVVTIDLKHGKLERMGETFDRVAFWLSLGITNIDLFLVADDAEKREIVNSLDFDFAFIDGEHTTQGVTEDFALVQRCGRVLFHDYDLSVPKDRNDVYHFVNTLPADELEVLDIFVLWTKCPIDPMLLQKMIEHRIPRTEARAIVGASLLSVHRLDGIIDACDLAAAVEGDTAEIGTARGGTSKLIATLNPGRQHWACDTFQGLLDVGPEDTGLKPHAFASMGEEARRVLEGLDNVQIVPGFFPMSARKEMEQARYSLVHIDVDTYGSIKGAFEFFADRMSPGGIVVADDVLEHGCPGAQKAWRELSAAHGDRWEVVKQNAPQEIVRFRG